MDESADDIPLGRFTSEVKASQAIPIVLVGNSSYLPDELRSTVDLAVEKLRDPQEVVNALDQVLGINVPRASGEALDDPGTT